jgi:hypothetical protein
MHAILFISYMSPFTLSLPTPTTYHILHTLSPAIAFHTTRRKTC